MDKIQKLFDSQLDEIINKKIESILYEKLREQLSQQGIKLNKKQILEIAKKIRGTEGNTVNFTFDDGLPSEDIVRNIKIDLANIDKEKVLSEFNSRLNKSIPQIIADTSKFLFTNFKNQAFRNVKLQRLDRKEFETRLEKRWRKPFSIFEIYLAIVIEIGFDSNENHRQNYQQNPDLVFAILIRLHARASQIALEIITLIKAGLADGAHARWRTSHEVAVVSEFIKKHGKEVAEMYDSHSCVESYKASLQYQNYAEALNQRKIPEVEMNQIKKEYDDSLIKFGTNFRESYGWAATALNIKKPTFADIETDVEMDIMRPYYKMASHNVHANPKGISFKLGLPDKRAEIMLAGSSSTGFADPAQGAAISLLHTTSTILLNKPSIDDLVMFNVLVKFTRLIGEEFLKTQIKYESKPSKKNVP